MPQTDFKKFLKIGIENNQIPKDLFQYRTIDLCKLILENSKLKFSSPIEFNDPFDCQIAPDTNNTEEEIREFVKANNDRNLTNYQIENLVKKTVKDPENWKKILEPTFDRVINSTGVCCFTTEDNNLLMWSHYTDSHKGVCLKFNVLKDLDFFLIPLKVNYSNKYPIYNHLKNRDNLVNDMVLTKSKIWEYENEIRVIKINKVGLHSFNKESLEEIVFGCNATDKDIDDIKKLASKHGYNITFKKAQKKQNEFGLEII